MLYNYDPYKLAVQLFPPLLRSPYIFALSMAITMPLRRISQSLKLYRKEVANKVNTTANVIVLEGALNRAFYLDDRQIYITTRKNDRVMYLFRSSENRPVYVHTISEGGPLYLTGKGEPLPGADFDVYIPNFLATSLIYDEDEHNGIHLIRIVDILNRYKPVGKSYQLKLYNYE